MLSSKFTLLGANIRITLVPKSCVFLSLKEENHQIQNLLNNYEIFYYFLCLYF